jgi:NRAMP (natural resistance-associated macrophage protein)-like metal ion transporter
MVARRAKAGAGAGGQVGYGRWFVDVVADPVAPPRRPRWRARFVVLAAVVGPGLLAGLSDDDPAGITTYSVLGADHGYSLLWVLTLSIVALTLFQDLGARLGIVTGQGLAGLLRQRFGARRAGLALVALVLANFGTTCAEFAGIAAGMELFGVSRYVSVPVAAFAVGTLVMRGSYKRIERLLLALSAVFLTYIAAGILAHPNWGSAARGLVVPTMPSSRAAILIATATIGTTLAPWGQAFIQSYVVDKRLGVKDLRYVRWDVVTGSMLTGIIGFFIVVACAATLHVQHIKIKVAEDAARALEPLAGSLASSLFGVGLVGAALLAAFILPLSTAYSVAEFLGTEGALDRPLSEAPVFYSTYLSVLAAAAFLVLIPSAPLVPILVLSQVLNAVLLLPLLGFMLVISGDRKIMGEYIARGPVRIMYVVCIVFIAACVGALAILSIG